MGLVFLAVALAGFGPSFVFPVFSGDFDFPFRVYAHAIIMFGWLFLYIAQAGLIAAHRHRLHKALGLSSVVIFPALMISIVTISVNSVLAPVPPPVEILLDNIFFLQLVAFFLTPVFFVLALAARRKRPDHHKRYMYFVTFFLLEAAASRMTFLPGMADNSTFLKAQYFYLDVFLLTPLLIYDFRTLGRLSRATVIGLVIFAVYQAIALLVWYSPWWTEVMAWIEPALADALGRS